MPAPSSLRTPYKSPGTRAERPGIARAHASAPPLTRSAVLTWLARADAAGTPWLAWRDPKTGVELVGVGRITQSEQTRRVPARDGAAGTCSRNTKQPPDVSGPPLPPGLPVEWSGQSFAPRTPQAPWTGWPQAQRFVPRLLAYTGPAGSGWVAAARADDDDPAGRLRRLLSEVPVAGNPVPTSPAPAAANPLVPDAEWLATVSRARAAIHAGDLEKVVLARGVHLRGPRPFSAPGTLAALWDAYPSAFGFAISLGPPGCFLGATPELLVRTRGRRVSAQALAGTAPRGADPQADADLGQALLGCPKNRLEHSWVTRAIRDALSPLCETVHVPSSPRLLQLAGLQHLETPISGRLRAGIAGEQVAAALHPTPALGGWPQAEALAWIEREEQLARGWYAAPIGASTLDGESVFAVGIRSALLRGHDAWAFAGAGIVADSVPELELAETALKLRTVTGALRSEAP